MDKKPTWWQIMKIKLSMGRPLAPVQFIDQDTHTVIRFKTHYISIMEKDEKIVDLGWSNDPHMFPDVNINDYWIARDDGKTEDSE